jgi:hypothetical protein
MPSEVPQTEGAAIRWAHLYDLGTTLLSFGPVPSPRGGRIHHRARDPAGHEHAQPDRSDPRREEPAEMNEYVTVSFPARGAGGGMLKPEDEAWLRRQLDGLGGKGGA